MNDSAISQRNEGEIATATFMKERVHRFLDNLEKSLKANDKSDEWVMSSNMTYADVVLF